MVKNAKNSGKALTYIVIIIALALIVAGYRNGEHQSYFQKAIMVCTQCIGLG